MMSIVIKYLLISSVLINLFIVGLCVIARSLTIKKFLPFRNLQKPKTFQFWLIATIPALGYFIVNLPLSFNWVSDFGRKLSVTSLFPFLICQIFIPALIAFLVNTFVPVVTNMSKAIMFSIPVFLMHVYYVARSWLFPLIHDLQAIQSPIRQSTFALVEMQMLVGVALLIEVVFVSWFSATAIKQTLKNRA